MKENIIYTYNMHIYCENMKKNVKILRSLYIEYRLWERAKKFGKKYGVSASKIVEWALKEYFERHEEEEK